MNWFKSMFSDEDETPSSDWRPSYSVGVTLKLSTGGFYFDFPAPPGHVNYIMKPHEPVKPGQLLTVRYKVETLSGKPKFNSLDTEPGLPPNFRPMLQRKGDNWQDANGRFWSTPHGILDSPGNIIKVVLGSSNWTGVYGGSPTIFVWKDFLDNLGNIALTFGGGTSFGHGVNVTGGKVRFTLLEYSIK